MYAPISLFPSVSLINKIKFNLLKERNSVAVVLVIQTKRPSVCYVTEIKLSGALNVIKLAVNTSKRYQIILTFSLRMMKNVQTYFKTFPCSHRKIFKILLTIFDLLQSKPPYSVQMQKKSHQKKLCIWKLFAQCYLY